MKVALLSAVFLVSICGLLFQLIGGALASYLLGDTVTQFSLVIGLSLAGMGIGSYLSRFFQTQLLTWFVALEIALGIVGGFFAPSLLLAFAYDFYFAQLLYGLVGLIGILVGLEIPLLLRLIAAEGRFKNAVSNVMTLDSLGAPFAALLFPLFFMPRLGLIQTSLLTGLMSCGVALFITCAGHHSFPRWATLLRIKCVIAMCLLIIALWNDGIWSHLIEN